MRHGLKIREVTQLLQTVQAQASLTVAAAAGLDFKNLVMMFPVWRLEAPHLTAHLEPLLMEFLKAVVSNTAVSTEDVDAVFLATSAFVACSPTWANLHSMVGSKHKGMKQQILEHRATQAVTRFMEELNTAEAENVLQVLEEAVLGEEAKEKFRTETAEGGHVCPGYGLQGGPSKVRFQL